MDEHDEFQILVAELLKAVKTAPTFAAVLEERDGVLQFVRDEKDVEFEEAFDAALDAAYGPAPPTPDD